MKPMLSEGQMLVWNLCYLKVK